METPSKWQMTERQRGLIFRVANGYSPCFQLIFNLMNHYPRCEKILEYLLKNKLTGEKLFIWIKQDMQNSPLAAWKYCLSKVDGDRNFKVILGKDFV